MLQIATGRFFGTSPVWQHSGVGILYSNFSWVSEIETPAGTLEPSDGMGAAPSSWVFRYINRMEKREGPGVLVRTGDAELVEQFQLLCSLGLKAFFQVDRDIVVHSCRARPLGRHDHSPPSMFVTRILDSEVRGTTSEKDAFVEFVGNCLALPRKRYKALIAAARATYDSLVVASHNIHLAYSMLVYVLESLTQEFDGFTATWQHFDETTRLALDDKLATISDETSAEIREILVGTSHAKLMARFVHFVGEHVRDSFYESECPKGISALPASDLVRSLQTAYATRSGFAHKLAPIQHHLSIPQIARGEVFEWERKPHLTYRGLLRLVQHVLHSFVSKSPKLTSEEVDWRSDLPGVVTMKAAPQYWIWNATNFVSSSGTKVLAGLISHLDDVKRNKGAITDMRAVVEACMMLFSQAKASEKPALLCIVVLFNAHVDQSHRVDGWEGFVENHSSVLDRCCVEGLLLDLQLGRGWAAPAAEVTNCVQQFMERRHHKGSIELHRNQLTALLLGTYNALLDAGDLAEARKWARKALLDEGGNEDVQTLIRVTIQNSERFDLARVLWGENAVEAASTTDEEQNSKRKTSKFRSRVKTAPNKPLLLTAHGKPVASKRSRRFGRRSFTPFGRGGRSV
jgi:hypothetical protein